MTKRGEPRLRHRRSIRLSEFDYRQPGAYFITICARDRNAFFGAVVDGEMRRNAPGEVAARCWAEIPDHFPNVALDEWVVMPNHLHGIVLMPGTATAAVPLPDALPLRHAPERFATPVAGSVPTILRSFKSAVTREINQCLGTPGAAVWQRGYFEHVVRDEASLARIRNYIASNPQRWDSDPENPSVGANVSPADGVGARHAVPRQDGSPDRPAVGAGRAVPRQDGPPERPAVGAGHAVPLRDGRPAAVRQDAES